VIKEQQLVLQLNIFKQDALAKSEVINSLMAATREAEIRCARQCHIRREPKSAIIYV
jgi:hypothetical protein